MRHDYAARFTPLHAFEKISEGRFDRLFVLVVLVLIGFGLVMLTSASIGIAEKRMQEPLYYLYRQSAYLGVGLLLAMIVFKTNTEQWLNQGYLALIIGFLLLIAVLIFGVRTKGGVRWINLGIFNLQVAEVAKLFLIVYLSGYLVRHNKEACNTLFGLAKPMFFILLFSALILAERDFGGALVLLLLSAVMLFLAGVKISMFASVFGVIFSVSALFAIFVSYRMKRLVAFLDPWKDAGGDGYQLVNSLVAFGMGGVSGVGVGGSVQKLFYLPEPHTDFVLAVIGEELGLIGTATVLLLFGLLIWRAFLIGARAMDSKRVFPAYVAYGIATWIAVQALINIAVNLGVLPTKGLPLPLISYGGTNLVVTLVAIAMLLRIDYETRIGIDEERGPRKRRVR
jgi:cell division protein FtsW